MGRKAGILRIALVITLVVGILAAQFVGLGGSARPAGVRELIIEWGAWGPVVYCVGFSVWMLLGLPNLLFVLAAPLTWPPLEASLIAWVGSVASASFVFGVARTVGRQWVRRRLGGRLQSLDARLESGALSTVIGLRLIFFLAVWISAGLGVSRVRAHDYVIGSAIGVFPGVLVLVLLREGAAAWLRSGPTWRWVAIAIALVLLLGARRLARRVAKREKL